MGRRRHEDRVAGVNERLRANPWTDLPVAMREEIVAGPLPPSQRPENIMGAFPAGDGPHGNGPCNCAPCLLEATTA